MANIKISQLPSWTGTAADLRWFVMNNSGETETFKFSGYTSPYKIGDGTDSVVSVKNPTAYAPGQNTWVSVFGTNSTMTPGIGTFVWGRDQVVQSSTTSILMGDQNTSLGNAYSVMIGGYQNSSNGGVGISIIGGAQNQTNNSPQWSGIFGGQNNQINAGTHNFIGGGYNNTIQGGGQYNTIINGNTNTISSSSNHNAIIGGSSNSMGSGVASTTITAAYNNTNVGNSQLGFIAATQDNTLTSLGYTFALIGGGYNNVNNQNASAGNAMYSSYFCNDTTSNSGGASINTFFGAHTSTITGWGKLNNITNSYSSTITNNPSTDVGEWFNKIDSSSGSTITTSKQSQILGGNDNTISGKTRAVMVGCSGRTADSDNTTYVENLKVHRQIYGGIKDLGTIGGVISVDWNEGNIQYFTLSATSSFQFASTSVRDGATYILKIKQPAVGNHTLSWSVLIKWPNGSIPVLSTTPNAEDIITFVVIGGTLYGNIQKAFS